MDEREGKGKKCIAGKTRETEKESKKRQTHKTCGMLKEVERQTI